ncbi:septation regulator SpoVG [Heliobacterium chlorum]|uniref:Putative septation protein SpoVG n=1 Tax=Heliobacterium chlorum TaxID=2698 RepID=A0ABR7T527_HELCL|nr:septation regulator SpoVG [Heliobacterium chlorum]MBC9784766.1 septation regulator SpoVG [Heliobacterium chlorum]
MEITDVKIRKLDPEGKIKAIISITINNMVAIHDIRVVDGPNGIIVAMPSRRSHTGEYRDIVHPISRELRNKLFKSILDAYFRASQKEDGQKTCDYFTSDSSD